MDQQEGTWEGLESILRGGELPLPPPPSSGGPGEALVGSEEVPDPRGSLTTLASEVGGPLDLTDELGLILNVLTSPKVRLSKPTRRSLQKRAGKLLRKGLPRKYKKGKHYRTRRYLARAYRKDNIDFYRNYMRYYKRYKINTLYDKLRYRSSIKKYTLDISKEDFISLVSIILDNNYLYPKDIYIRRLDNTKRYISLDNITIISKIGNIVLYP